MKNFFKFLVFVGIIAICIGDDSIDETVAISCSANELPTKCEVPCQPTCADQKRTPCETLLCGKPDCVCKDGFIRLYDGGPCVLIGGCRQCGLNETLVECDNPCQPTCKDPKRSCQTFTCGSPDCVCEPGFIRSVNNGLCIPTKECTRCGQNEEIVSCQVPCQPTCQKPKMKPCPTKACGGYDCVCKKNFIRYIAKGRCVASERCRSFLQKP